MEEKTQEENLNPLSYPLDKKFYGRRQGKKLSNQAQKTLDTFLQERMWSPTQLMLKKIPKQTPKASLCGKKMMLEIGFGSGEHLVKRLASDQSLCALGVEPFQNGLAKLAKQCAQTPDITSRLWVWPHPIESLWEHLPPCFFDEVVIFFPDPWPKKRHRKRRLIQKPFLQKLATSMKQKAYLNIASDDACYMHAVQVLLSQTPLFHQTGGLTYDALHHTPQTWPDWPKEWPLTRYAQKALALGKKLGWITAKKIPS